MPNTAVKWKLNGSKRRLPAWFFNAFVGAIFTKKTLKNPVYLLLFLHLHSHDMVGIVIIDRKRLQPGREDTFYMAMAVLGMLMTSTAVNGSMRLILLVLILVAVALLLTGGTIAIVTFFSVRRAVAASLESERP